MPRSATASASIHARLTCAAGARPRPAIAESLPTGLRRQALQAWAEIMRALAASPDTSDRKLAQSINQYLQRLPAVQAIAADDLDPLALQLPYLTYGDGKNSTLNDIDDHRVTIDGYSYWVMRVNPQDARARGVKHHDLIRIHNDRGSVVCVADVSPLVGPGVCKSYESSAEVDFFDDPRYGRVDRGGCVNVLTPRRPQVKNTDGMASNSCLVEFEPWVSSGSELKRA